jgi:hypothetical protein
VTFFEVCPYGCGAPQGAFGYSSSPLVIDNLSSPDIHAVVEPSTWTMMLLGFAGLGFAGYRRAKAGHGTLAA